jgi:hypothetical protein
MTTDLVGHYQGFFDGITGYKLPQGMRSQAERCAASKAVKPKVTELKPGPPSYHFLKSIEVVDRAIIIARGAKARQLDLLELEESGLIKTNHRMATSIPGILSPMILGQDFSARSAPLRATVPWQALLRENIWRDSIKFMWQIYVPNDRRLGNFLSPGKEGVIQ